MSRWRLALPLVSFSALCLSFSVIGAGLSWAGFSPADRALTVLIALTFAGGLALSVSIGADRRITDVPWARLGLVVLVLASGFGAVLVRG